MRWDHFRRGYNWAMTQNMKKILRSHHDMLFGTEAVKRYGQFDVDAIFKGTCLQDIDELCNRRRAGYNSLEEYYKTESCVNYINNVRVSVVLGASGLSSFRLLACANVLDPIDLHV